VRSCVSHQASHLRPLFFILFMNEVFHVSSHFAFFWTLMSCGSFLSTWPFLEEERAWDPNEAEYVSLYCWLFRYSTTEYNSFIWVFYMPCFIRMGHGSLIDWFTWFAIHRTGEGGFGYKIFSPASIFTAELTALFVTLQHIGEVIKTLVRWFTNVNRYVATYCALNEVEV
jgi:hypothetical protein